MGNIADLWDALWLVLVTITTVGYGDLYPVTKEGQAIIVVLMYVSCLYLSIPIGIIGNAFSTVWDDRERMLVVALLRSHVKKAGYTALDLYNMFTLLDQNGNNELSVDEFVELMPLMNLEMFTASSTQSFSRSACAEFHSALLAFSRIGVEIVFCAPDGGLTELRLVKSSSRLRMILQRRWTFDISSVASTQRPTSSPCRIACNRRWTRRTRRRLVAGCGCRAFFKENSANPLVNTFMV